MREIFLYFDVFSVYNSACGNYFKGCVQNETQVSNVFIYSYISHRFNLSNASLYTPKRFRFIHHWYCMECDFGIWCRVLSLTKNLFGTIQAFSFHRFIMGCAFRHFDWRVLFLYLCRYFWTTHNKLDQRDYHCPNGLFTSTFHVDGRRVA